MTLQEHISANFYFVKAEGNIIAVAFNKQALQRLADIQESVKGNEQVFTVLSPKEQLELEELVQNLGYFRSAARISYQLWVVEFLPTAFTVAEISANVNTRREEQEDPNYPWGGLNQPGIK
jgi:hypothetical protein